MAASAELLRHVALRRAASNMARVIMEGEYEDDATVDGSTDQAAVAAAKELAVATSKTAQAANPQLAGVTKEEAISTSEFLRLYKAERGTNMSDTKESVWALVLAHGAADHTTDSMGVTADQAVATFLGTPEGNKLMERWKKAPWDAGGQVRKEETGAPRGSSTIHRSAADEAELQRLGNEAAATIK